MKIINFIKYKILHLRKPLTPEERSQLLKEINKLLKEGEIIEDLSETLNLVIKQMKEFKIRNINGR